MPMYSKRVHKSKCEHEAAQLLSWNQNQLVKLQMASWLFQSRQGAFFSDLGIEGNEIQAEGGGGNRSCCRWRGGGRGGVRSLLSFHPYSYLPASTTPTSSSTSTTTSTSSTTTSSSAWSASGSCSAPPMRLMFLWAVCLLVEDRSVKREGFRWLYDPFEKKNFWRN